MITYKKETSDDFIYSLNVNNASRSDNSVNYLITYCDKNNEIKKYIYTSQGNFQFSPKTQMVKQIYTCTFSLYCKTTSNRKIHRNIINRLYKLEISTDNH